MSKYLMLRDTYTIYTIHSFNLENISENQLKL